MYRPRDVTSIAAAQNSPGVPRLSLPPLAAGRAQTIAPVPAGTSHSLPWAFCCCDLAVPHFLLDLSVFSQPCRHISSQQTSPKKALMSHGRQIRAELPESASFALAEGVFQIKMNQRCQPLQGVNSWPLFPGNSPGCCSHGNSCGMRSHGQLWERLFPLPWSIPAGRRGLMQPGGD